LPGFIAAVSTVNLILTALTLQHPWRYAAVQVLWVVAVVSPRKVTIPSFAKTSVSVALTLR